MRTVASEPVSPVAIPAKDSITGRESETPELGVDLAVNCLTVLGSATLDVVKSEELGVPLTAAGTLAAVGVEDSVAQLSFAALPGRCDKLGVGEPPFGVLGTEPLSFGLSVFGVSLATTWPADVASADCGLVDDEL